MKSIKMQKTINTQHVMQAIQKEKLRTRINHIIQKHLKIIQ